MNTTLAEPKTLTILIGNLPAEDEAPIFHAMDTAAPAAYDGFRTFTITEYNDGERDIRTVLIRDEHLNWQTARYSSGLFACTPTVHDTDDIARAIWDRIAPRKD